MEQNLKLKKLIEKVLTQQDKNLSITEFQVLDKYEANESGKMTPYTKAVFLSITRNENSCKILDSEIERILEGYIGYEFIVNL